MCQVKDHKHRICSAQLGQFICLLTFTAGTKLGLALGLIWLQEQVLVTDQATTVVTETAVEGGELVMADSQVPLQLVHSLGICDMWRKMP